MARGLICKDWVVWMKIKFDITNFNVMKINFSSFFEIHYTKLNLIWQLIFLKKKIYLNFEKSFFGVRIRCIRNACAKFKVSRRLDLRYPNKGRAGGSVRHMKSVKYTLVKRISCPHCTTVPLNIKPQTLNSNLNWTEGLYFYVSLKNRISTQCRT